MNDEISEQSDSSTPPKPPVPIPKSYDERRVREEFWPKLKRAIARVPGLSDVLALYYYLNSDRAPLRHKISILATLAYFILPIDAIPDFLGPLGYTDDIAVALGLISFIGSDIMLPYRIYARRWLRGLVPGDLDLKVLDGIDTDEDLITIDAEAIEVTRER